VRQQLKINAMFLKTRMLNPSERAGGGMGKKNKKK
jgi:hypothetical protein